MSGGADRCLVLTLYSGENEFERSRDSLHAQEQVEWEHRVFEHLPNKEAHDRLYREIMDRTEEFRLFVKLDADMVFTGPKVLASILALFREDPEFDHGMFELRDFMSDGPLMGLHAYSNRVRWRRSSENLFVDPDPTIPGHRRMVRGHPAPVADHAPDPGPYQAFHFGVHRALKAFQPGTGAANHDQALKQWSLLTRVWDHFERSRDTRLGLAVLGADLVWRGELGAEGAEFADAATREHFDRHRERTSNDLHEALAGRWREGAGRALRWAVTGGPKVVRGLIRSRIMRAARSKDPGS